MDSGESRVAGWRLAVATASIGGLGLFAIAGVLSLPLFASLPFVALGISDSSFAVRLAGTLLVAVAIDVLWTAISSIARRAPAASGYDIVLLRVTFGAELVLCTLGPLLLSQGFLPEIWQPFILGCALGSLSYYGIEWRRSNKRFQLSRPGVGYEEKSSARS